MTTRSMLSKYRPEKHMFPTGSYAYMISGSGLGASLDPFLQIDHFRMAHATFPPHPHAGMSAVTYMFDDAATGFVNRDSLGDRTPIRPGDLHWTQAGAGMMHEEVPIEPGRWAHGFQIFVNLAARHKEAPPRALHLDHERMPIVALEGGGSLKIAVGCFDNHVSPVTENLLTPVNLFELRLPAHGRTVLSLGPDDLNVFATVLKGSASTGEASLIEGESGHFGRIGPSRIEIRAGDAGLWAMLMSGVPLDEPVFPKGPFVGNTSADIARYVHRFQKGGMGSLSQSF